MGPHALNISALPSRLCDLQDTLDKLMHFLPQLSDFVPLQNEYYLISAHSLISSHAVNPATNYAVVPRGVADL